MLIEGVLGEDSLDEWALVDWDNTIRPGFAMIDWTEFLASHDRAFCSDK